MKSIRSSSTRSRGFTLIEALVTLVVMAFGLLALAGFQASLSSASESAKQRAEAVRLAQQKIEELRAYQQTASDGKTVGQVGNIYDYAIDVVSGGPETLSKTSTDAYNTANAYTRQWWLTQADGTTAAGPTDLQKWARVMVSWTDRNGQTQNVTLQSVIARSDPADLGTIGVGPGKQIPRTPKNRNVDIPYPAVTLSGGKSALRPPGSSVTYVFDNTTGDVIGNCTQTLNAGDSVDVNSTSGCVAQKAYLLSGYIRFLENVPNTGGNETNYDRAISNPVDNTKELTAGVAFASFTPGGVPAPACYTQRQKVVSTNNAATSAISAAVRLAGTVTITTSSPVSLTAGQIVSINDTANPSFVGQFSVVTVIDNRNFTYLQSGSAASTTGGTASLIQQLTIAESDASPSGYTSVQSRFVAYTCVVVPWDHDGDETATPPASPPTRRRWWGQFYITPQITSPDASVWTLASSGNGSRKVCRFSGDYVIDNKISNSEHPWWYRGVDGALDNQNYLIIPSNTSCPTNGKTDPLASNYINVNTVRHQTASGTAAGGNASTSNTQWSTTAEPNGAPADINDVLPMF